MDLCTCRSGARCSIYPANDRAVSTHADKKQVPGGYAARLLSKHIIVCCIDDCFYFSSAGCQTVAGRYDNGVPSGAWAEFRKAAGLAHPPNFVAGSRQNTADDGRAFDYLLLTGKEAQLAASGSGNALRTLRFGASGEGVSELQEKLAALPEGARVQKTGVFDWKTLGGVLRWQKENKVAPTGIIAAQTAAVLGLKWS